MDRRNDGRKSPATESRRLRRERQARPSDLSIFEAMLDMARRAHASCAAATRTLAVQADRESETAAGFGVQRRRTFFHRVGIPNG